MTRRLKKLTLAVLALGLVAGNTDWGIGIILALLPGRHSPLRLFILFALIANLQALIWYQMGRGLVDVLGDCYRSISRWYGKPGIKWLMRWLLGWMLSTLRPFHEWEATKANIHGLLKAVLQSKKALLAAIFSWLILPGTRSITAILFGMEEWPGAMVALLIVNTFHVALSFAFWSALIMLGRWAYN